MLASLRHTWMRRWWKNWLTSLFSHGRTSVMQIITPFNCLFSYLMSTVCIRWVCCEPNPVDGDITNQKLLQSSLTLGNGKRVREGYRRYEDCKGGSREILFIGYAEIIFITLDINQKKSSKPTAGSQQVHDWMFHDSWVICSEIACWTYFRRLCYLVKYPTKRCLIETVSTNTSNYLGKGRLVSSLAWPMKAYA